VLLLVLQAKPMDHSTKRHDSDVHHLKRKAGLCCCSLAARCVVTLRSAQAAMVAGGGLG
jgi:hypothetical protein